MAIRIMTTQEYADIIYSKLTKTGTCSQQLIRRMIKEGKKLPQVKGIIHASKYYHLLEVEQ